MLLFLLYELKTINNLTVNYVSNYMVCIVISGFSYVNLNALVRLGP
jgi:hypothetical protein